MGGRRCAIATLWVCLAWSGCLSDLKEPPGQDGGGPGGADAARDGDGAVIRPMCDPAGPFGVPEPLQTAGGAINDAKEQAWPRVSGDDLTLYYVEADDKVGAGLVDGVVVRVRRAGDDAAEPFDMGSERAEQNFEVGPDNEAPFLSADGSRLYYNDASQKTFASERRGTEELFPYPGDELGINEPASRDLNPYLVGDDRLYFASSRRHEDGTLELYSSSGTDGAFDEAAPLDIVTDPPHMQFAPVVSSDERVVFFSADGAIYRTVKTNGTFDTAEAVEELNDGFSFPGSLSPDDCLLYFHSDRRIPEGDYDIFVARAEIVF